MDLDTMAAFVSPRMYKCNCQESQVYLQKLKCGKKVSSWKTSTVHWVVTKFWWFIVLMSKSHHRGSHCRPNIFCLTLNKGEYSGQMHLHFTTVIGTKMMQSLVFMKKPSSEGKTSVRCKAAIKRKSWELISSWEYPKFLSSIFSQWDCVRICMVLTQT